MRVLLIEDDDAYAECIVRTLETEDMRVFRTAFGEEGVYHGRFDEFNLILLDTSLPDISGFRVLKELRRYKAKTPIIIISALCDLKSKVNGLNFGADDYITKPYHKDELIARIYATVRRSGGSALSTIEVGSLSINLPARRAYINKKQVFLTGIEYQILEILALRRGTVVSKETFVELLYGDCEEQDPALIKLFTCKLRKKLAEAGEGKNYIDTVWERGYALRDPDSEVKQTSRTLSRVPKLKDRLHHDHAVL